MHYALLEADGSVARFDRLDRLIAIDRPGDVAASVTIKYRYGDGAFIETITDGLGRVLTFHYHQDFISQIVLPDGQAINYRHDDDGNLVAVDYGNGQVKKYLYHEAGLASADQRNLLTGIISEDGRRYASFGYDAQGRAISSVLHDGSTAADGTAHAVERTTLNYTSDTSVQVTDDGNGSKTYTIQPGLYRRIVGISDANGRFGYQLNSDGRLSGQTDPRGITTSYGYTDTYRNRESEAVGTVQARDITVTRSDDHLVVQRKIQPSGGSGLTQIETFAYDSDRRLIAACTLDPAVAGASDYACGSSASPPSGVMQATQSYCGSDPGHCAHRKGDLATVLNGAGQVVLQVGAYDGAGRPLTLSDGNGNTTKIAYDGRGRVHQISQQSALQAGRVITRQPGSWPSGRGQMARDGRGSTMPRCG